VLVIQQWLVTSHADSCPVVAHRIDLPTGDQIMALTLHITSRDTVGEDEQ